MWASVGGEASGLERLGGRRRLLYRGYLNPVAELSGEGELVSLFIYGSKPHVPDYMVREGKTYRLVTDHLGSVRMVVDMANGAVAQTIDYDEFGEVLLDTNPGFQPFGFAGGLYDADTGLVRFGARDYDPVVGRWTSRDPIGLGGGRANLYVYAGVDPMNRIDPSGLQRRPTGGYYALTPEQRVEGRQRASRNAGARGLAFAGAGAVVEAIPIAVGGLVLGSYAVLEALADPSPAGSVGFSSTVTGLIAANQNFANAAGKLPSRIALAGSALAYGLSLLLDLPNPGYSTDPRGRLNARRREARRCDP